MNLREAIKDISDDDWLEITEQSTAKYKSAIGRAPKKYITGEVLDYEVLSITRSGCMSDYILHSIIVKDNWCPKEVSQ
ncbi:hypothetical protein OGZ37_05945 [Lactococcus lactis]|uniref:hypothetical protein n=1 Tax=Lactococcus lactis TaxID=1358 RepID=UPI00241840FE|nr:hypothetical protein [Lactococcus lactis]MDG4966117.1 hypothetical protein [Lactococcus lactis]